MVTVPPSIVVILMTIHRILSFHIQGLFDLSPKGSPLRGSCEHHQISYKKETGSQGQLLGQCLGPKDQPELPTSLSRTFPLPPPQAREAEVYACDEGVTGSSKMRMRLPDGMGEVAVISDSHSQWWGLHVGAFQFLRACTVGGLAGTKRKAGGSADPLGFGDWAGLGGENKK